MCIRDRAVVPPNITIVPIGVRGIDFKKLFFVTLNTPVSPVGLFISSSSEFSAEYVTVLLEINVFAIDILNVFVLPPVWPSNSKLAACTSPLTENVVALASLSADPALPLTVPLTLPWIFP